MKDTYSLTKRRESPRQLRKAARQARREGLPIIRKASHVLPHEMCVLFVQDAGYVADFEPGARLAFVDAPERARVCCEHVAPRVALAIREETGLRVAVRLYRPHADALPTVCPSKAH